MYDHDAHEFVLNSDRCIFIWTDHDSHAIEIQIPIFLSKPTDHNAHNHITQFYSMKLNSRYFDTLLSKKSFSVKSVANSIVHLKFRRLFSLSSKPQFHEFFCEL